MLSQNLPFPSVRGISLISFLIKEKLNLIKIERLRRKSSRLAFDVKELKGILQADGFLLIPILAGSSN